MTKPEAAREFQRLLLLNGATLSPPNPELFGYEPSNLFDHWNEP